MTNKMESEQQRLFRKELQAWLDEHEERSCVEPLSTLSNALASAGELYDQLECLEEDIDGISGGYAKPMRHKYEYISSEKCQELVQARLLIGYLKERTADIELVLRNLSEHD